MTLPPFANLRQIKNILFENTEISKVSVEQAKFVGSILCNIGYDMFFLIKNNKTYEFNVCHYKIGNDLMVLEGFYEENHIMYFYLRNTTVAREYNNTDDEFPETYYLLVVYGKEL